MKSVEEFLIYVPNEYHYPATQYLYKQLTEVPHECYSTIKTQLPVFPPLYHQPCLAKEASYRPTAERIAVASLHNHLYYSYKSMLL